MFLSYVYSPYISNEESEKYNYPYKIVDSEFEEVGVNILPGVRAGVSVAVIDTYEKRNLNVAANLVRAFIWLSKGYSWLSISEIVSWNKLYNLKFAKYEKDVEKYLVLI